MSNFWETAPLENNNPQSPQTPPAQPAGNFWESAPVASQPAAPAPAAPPAATPSPTPTQAMGMMTTTPQGEWTDDAKALGYGTARSVAPALAGGAAASAIGAGLTATGVGAPVGIPLSILGAFAAGFGVRYGQDKLIPPSAEEERLARENPTAYNTIPAVVTMPLGGGRFGVQNIKDLGAAVSAARAGRVLTEVEKAAAISAGTQVGVNAAIPAATRAYNVSQGGEFGLGDYLIEAGAAPFVGGKSYRPVEAVQNVAATVGFKAGDAMRRGARSAGQTVGATPRPTAAGEVNQPATVFNGVELVMPEGFNPRIWAGLTDEGRYNAIKDFEARAAAAAQAAQAAAPQPAPMAPPRPEQGTLPVPPATAEAAAPAPQATQPPVAADAPAPLVRPTTVKPQDWDGMNDETKRLILAELADSQIPPAPANRAVDPAPTSETPPAADTAAPEPRLPRDLAGAKPRFGYGQKNVELTFESDLDRAAYIVSQANKNKRHDDYVAWATKTFGMTEEQLAAHGQRVRAAAKAAAKDAEGTTATVGRVERAATAPKPEAPVPAPRTPQVSTEDIPAPKPRQTEIPGAQDGFNLASEEVSAPAQPKPADTTADVLPETQEPAYVSEARRDLAALEAQGKGNSAKAKAIKNVIDEYIEKKNNPNIDYRGGEKIEFNGKTQQIAGGTFYEFVYLTGPKKGQIGVTQTPPRKPASTAPKPVEPAPEAKPAEDFDPAEDALRPGETQEGRSEVERAWAEEDAARPESTPAEREIQRLQGLKDSAEEQLSRIEKSGKGQGKQAQRLRKTIEGLRQDIAEQKANLRIRGKGRLPGSARPANEEGSGLVEVTDPSQLGSKTEDFLPGGKEDSSEMDWPSPEERSKGNVDAAGNRTGPGMWSAEPPVEVGGEARPVGSRELPATTEKPAQGATPESYVLAFRRQKKAEAKRRLDALLKSGKGEDDPDVKSARKRIDKWNKMIRDEEKKQRNASKPRDIEAEIEAKKEQIRQKEYQIARALEVEDMKGQDVASGDDGAEKAYRLAEAQVERRNKEMARLKKELADLEGEAKNLPDKNTRAPDDAQEPADVRRARKYIEDQSKAKKVASRAKLRQAEAVVEQYELDQLARDPDRPISKDELKDVSDDTLVEVADGIRNKEDNGVPVTDAEARMRQRYEDELASRADDQAVDDGSKSEITDERMVLDQGLDVLRRGVMHLPTLPKQYGASQISVLKENAPRAYRKFFRNPPGIKIVKNPTREQIKQAREAAEGMVAHFAESAGEGTTKYNVATTNSEEVANTFVRMLWEKGRVGPRKGSVQRLYQSIADDVEASNQGRGVDDVKEPDEAMPDVDVDPETGAAIRTEEVDPAEASLAGRDETPPNQMPPALDDGQGGKTLNEDTLPERLDKMAKDILGDEDEGRMHTVSPPVIAAMAWRTARAMQKGLINLKDFPTWSRDFVRRHGAAFKAYTQYIWDAAKNTYQSMFVNFKPRFIAGLAEKANQVVDRNQQSEAAKQVAAMLFNRPGAKTAGSGMGAPMQVEAAQARVRNRLGELAMQFRDKIAQMSDSERAMFNQLVRRIHEGNAPMPKGWVGDFVRAMRDMMRNDPDAGLLAQQKAGVKIGDQGETYLPRNLDPVKVKAREAEFKKAAAEAYRKLWNRLNEQERLEMFPELGADPATRQPVNDAFFDAQAEAYFNRVSERITDGDLLPMFEGAGGGKPSVLKERVFNNAEAGLMESFYTNDYLGDIERYLASAARRKVTAETIGPNGEVLADLSKRMAAENVPADDRKELRDLLKKGLGIGREADSQSTASFFDTTGFVQGAVMLGRSFWNNLIQEPMQIGVRGSTKPFGIDAPINILRTYKDTYTNFIKDQVSLNPDQLRRFRMAMGKDPAFANELDRVLSEELGLNGFNDPSFYADTTGDFGERAAGLPALRRLTNKIFELNLLSPTEAAKVTASVTAARRFLADNLRFAAGESKVQRLFERVGIDIGGKRVAKLYLSELGIGESEIPAMLKFAEAVDAAQRSGDTATALQLIGSNDPWAARYREALGIFSRQSSIKPSRATKPEFQDHGLGRMFLQLKGFSYDFEQNINLRRWGLMKEAITGRNWGLYDRATMAGPLLWMPMTVAGTAAKFALMNHLYPSEATERRKKEGPLMKTLDAGSYEGAFGPFFESLFKSQRQQTPIGGALGQVGTDLTRAGVNAATSQADTNGPERQIARTAYRNVVKPAVAAGSTVLPKPAGVAVNLAMGATQPEAKFVDETAGKKGEKDGGNSKW